MRESQYRVRLAEFEGPLDLLLQLIEREELDITRIALAQVTDQYLAHLEQLQARKIEELAQFLVIAAKLLQIKSEALLPRPPERPPEEEDPGESLARQLIEYRRFKQAAAELESRERAGLRSFLRVAKAEPPPTELDLGGLGLEDLRGAMLEALAGMPGAPDLDEATEPPRVLIRDKIRELLAALEHRDSLSFLELMRQAATRLDVVVSFLALLELVKSRRLRATQERPFADILLTRGAEWAQGDQDLELEE